MMECFAPFCENRSKNTAKSHGITFHKFPTNPRVCAAWLQAIGKLKSQLPHGAVICSQHFLTEDFSESRKGLKKIRPGAVPFVLNDQVNDIQLSAINQKPAHSDKLGELEIACEISDNVDIKNEGADELNINNGKLFKQEPLDPDWTETYENVYDMHIDVVKEELMEKISEMENFSERYDYTPNIQAKVISEHKELKLWNSGHNMMINIKLEHCQEALLPADCAQTLGTPLLMEFIRTEDTRKETFSMKENSFSEQTQETYKIKPDKRHGRKHIDRCFSCDICKFKCTKKDNLERHIKTHYLEKAFSCDICKEKFYSKSKLNIHMRSHIDERTFSCYICNHKFRSEDLKKHMKTHSGSCEKPFCCDICQSKFTWKGGLDVHMRSHTGERPFTCYLCNYKFTTSGNLKKHMKTHSGEKPFFCDICQSKFTWKGSLDVHMKSHTGEKPFSCHICENKFTTKSNLTAHIKKHSGEKPFSCNICKKKYLTKGSLGVHMRNHTGEKPFPCNICNMKFTTKSQSKNHRKTHALK